MKGVIKEGSESGEHWLERRDMVVPPGSLQTLSKKEKRCY